MGRICRHRPDRGAAAVEFALVLVPLLLIVFGMVDFGRAYFYKVTVANAAHEGARASALGDSPGDVQSRVTAILPGAVATPAGCGQVTVTYQVDFLTPLPAFIPGLGSSVTVGGKGDEKCYS
jgi:Flp pilus assembly protein TadG